jgi:hypothetical protein
LLINGNLWKFCARGDDPTQISLPHLVIRPLLKKHFARFVEQEYAEGTMEFDVPILDSVTVTFRCESNRLIVVVHQNAVFLVQKMLLFLDFDAVSELS